MDRITVVSGDGHGGPSYETYRPYIEPAYRDLLDDLADEQEAMRAGLGIVRSMTDRDGLNSAADERGVLASETYMDLYEDVEQRLAQMDEEGIAGDMVLAGSEYALPFFHEVNKPYATEIRAAGLRAYHRWLADFVGQSGGRLFANAYALPSVDIDAMLAELRFVADRGFVSVEAPGYTADASLPPVTSDMHDPFWAACVDLGVVVNIHAGWGKKQGEVLAMLGMATKMVEQLTAGGPDAVADTINLMSTSADGEATFNPDPFLLEIGSRRAIWQLMLSGVFDRHPALKVALVEIRADWIPETLAYLDASFSQHATHLELKPSEYFARNFVVTPSSTRPYEVQSRHQIGIDQFMFGADMPHPEGTWPNTRKWLPHAFAGVPEDELRKLLGENAIRTYNLDRRPLDEAAARIGPTVAEVTDGIDLDERLLTHFDRRSGYCKPASGADEERLEELLADDYALVER